MVTTDVTGATNINTFDNDGFSSTTITKNGFMMGTRYNYRKPKADNNGSGFLSWLSNALMSLLK